MPLILVPFSGGWKLQVAFLFFFRRKIVCNVRLSSIFGEQGASSRASAIMFWASDVFRQKFTSRADQPPLVSEDGYLVISTEKIPANRKKYLFGFNINLDLTWHMTVRKDWWRFVCSPLLAGFTTILSNFGAIWEYFSLSVYSLYPKLLYREPWKVLFHDASWWILNNSKFKKFKLYVFVTIMTHSLALLSSEIIGA